MAIELKQGKTLEDPRNKSVSVNDPYGVVTQVNINHSKKTGRVIIEVYSRTCTSEERREVKVLPVLNFAEPVTAELYDEFFSKEVFDNGMNPQKAGYDLFESLEVDGLDEEGEPIKVKKYDAWKSDEE